MTTETDYEPYSEPWVREMNKLPKAYIINMFKDKAIENQRLKEDRDGLLKTLEEMKKENGKIK
jgi:hypothetical protein